MGARHIIYPDPEPVVGRVTHRTFPWDPATGTYTHTGPVADPVVATERMWWRTSGRVAYPPGATYPAGEQGLLVGDREHSANMRGEETRTVTATPEQRDAPIADEAAGGELERRPGGRPRLPRDEHGNIIRP
jgi:hypothetical protein